MKKLIFHFNKEKQNITVEYEDGTTQVITGLSMFAGDGSQSYCMLWGNYKHMAQGFMSAMNDAKYGDFFKWLRLVQNEVTPEEAIEKFSADICNCQPGECVCKKTKVYH